MQIPANHLPTSGYREINSSAGILEKQLQYIFLKTLYIANMERAMVVLSWNPFRKHCSLTL